jgi:Tol biopolymer transport system component
VRLATAKGRVFLRVSSAGELRRLERETGWTAVPGPVLSRFAKEHPGAKVDAARRVEAGTSTGWIVVAGKTEAYYPDAAPFEIRAGRPFEKTFPGEERLSDIRQLTFGGENAEAYFSPDGTKLIFQATVAPNRCDRQYVMDLATGEVTQVSSGKGRTTCGYFSYPDGKKIVYASTEAGGDDCPPNADMAKGYVWSLYDTYDLWLADADGKNPERITDVKGYDAEATWCHKGGKMIFTSVRDGDLELYERKDDGTITRLTHTPGYDGGAFYSPDCSEIVWRAGRPEGAALDEYRSLLAEGLIRPKNVEIYVANADGSNPRRLTNNGAANFCPYFTPDSKRVIFASNATVGGREFDLYLVSRHGGPLERVTTAPGFDGFPFFSPDGKWIVWASNRADPTARDTNLFLARWKP